MHRFTPLLALVTTLSPAFGAASVLDLLGTWNVAAMDYTMNGETEGSIAVAGTFTLVGTEQVAFNGGSVTDQSDYVLWLNNGIEDGTSTMNVQSGSVISRVAVDPARFNLQQAGNGATLTQGDASAWDQALNDVGLNSIAEARQIYADASAYWASLPGNSTVTGDGQNFDFTAGATDYNGTNVAVFNVDATHLSGTANLNANFANADSILINVAGTGDFTVSANFSGEFNSRRQQVLLNFYEADSVTFNSAVEGTVFAPGANIDQTGGNIEGSVVANQYSQANGEVHSYKFDGNLPVPEPSTAALTGLASLLLLRRRR